MEYKGSFDINFSLQGKIAFITGAASGIGYAIAEMFARKGARLFLVDRDAQVSDRAKELAETHHVEALGCAADLMQCEDMDALIQKCTDAYGGCDILVNNAGLSFLDCAEKLEPAKWDATIQLNLRVPFLLSQAFARYLIQNQKRGKIVNMASQAGVVALDQHVAYCASKAGVISMTQVCALEWGKYGIHVNCISPTVILTEMGKNYWKGEVGEAMKSLIPIGRFGYPEEVAAAAVYLASDAADLLTGTNLIMDGGYTIK